MVANDPYKPQLIIRDGEPVAVILPIAEYEDLLERLEQRADLEAIRSMTEQDWQTVTFEEYLRRKAEGASTGDHPAG